MITQLYAPIPAACDAEMVIIEGDDIYNLWHLQSAVQTDIFLNQQPIWRIERTPVSGAIPTMQRVAPFHGGLFPYQPINVRFSFAALSDTLA